MRVASDRDSPDFVDPSEYIREREEYEDKKNDFMRKFLRRAWPKRLLRILGVFQLVISLAILGVDLPICLMFAPRWQVFAGCWTFIFGFMACVSTLHSTRKMTWLKVKWTVGLNILAGVAAAIMVAFDILYLVNPYICLISSGCNYLWYTYSVAKSYYVGEVIVGIALLITVYIFLIIFIKYGIGGVTIFENIQNGRAPSDFNSIIPLQNTVKTPQNPPTGPGVFVARRTASGYMPRNPPPSGYVPRYPPPIGYMPRYPPPNGYMPRYPPPNGYMPRYPPPSPGLMMSGPPGPMMMPGSGTPMMVSRPVTPMMVSRPVTPMMTPGSRDPMQGYYRQSTPSHPPSAGLYQN